MSACHEKLQQFTKCRSSYIFLPEVSFPFRGLSDSDIQNVPQQILERIGKFGKKLPELRKKRPSSDTFLDVGADPGRGEVLGAPAAALGKAAAAQLSRDPTNFKGLVLGCIEAKFCK